MAKYLSVESRDPFKSNDVGYYYDLAAGLIGKGVDVYYVQDDAVARGIRESALVENLKPIARSGLAGLLGTYDQVWHW